MKDVRFVKYNVPQSIFSSSKKPLVIVVLLFLLSGCAGKLAYNNADFIISWYLSDYIEFTAEQEPIAKAKIDSWLTWHRSSEMPKYLAQLKTLKQQISTGKINRDVLQEHSERVETYWQTIREYVSADVSNFAMTLDISQMSQLFVTLADQREEDIEAFKKRTKKQPKRAERILENFADNLGYVTAEQKEIVHRYAEQLHSTYDMWMTHNANVQAKLREILIAKDFTPNSAERLENFMLSTDALRSAEYTAARNQNKQLYIAMLSDMFPTLETAQRDKLLDEIDTYIKLIQDIISS